MSFLDKLFRIDERAFKKIEKKAKPVFQFEEEYSKLSDSELQQKTAEFKKMIIDGKSVDDILPMAFATAREAAKRVLGQFPYPVQVFGATVLNEGDVAEMKTGEGKTLTATMAVYANALEGKGTHVVTVNEYLANRDATEMVGNVYKFLGLTVGVNLRELSTIQKQNAYNCDITYSTNSELGFDYLRDNMAKSPSSRVIRKNGLHYAIIDECDSILIDEARTPLIISGGSGITANTYQTADTIVKRMRKNKHFTIDIEKKTCSLTDEGIDFAQKLLQIDNLFDEKNADLAHRIQQALKANYIMKRDVEYMAKDDEILLIDTFTGRVMNGREYSDGLQQALQAKEHVKIKPETVTMATITYQNFFRLYDKLAGMTGTALTEQEEFKKVYNMRVIPIPTNKPIARIDDTDLIFSNETAKYNAIIDEVKKRHAVGQPILIGTPSVEKSEIIDDLLTKNNIPHEVLNAKNHEREAKIIEKAGQKDAVTIATNMAGRGTDIKLGAGIKELGGLAVLATERNESRRIDNQLKGRSGRQGDPGYSRFYVSFDDELFKRFGSNMHKTLQKQLGDDAVKSKVMQKAITSAQKKVEGANFDTRKQVLNYDDVLSRQRQIMYARRDHILYSTSVSDTIPGYFDTIGKYLCSLATFVKDQETLIDAKKLEAVVLEKLHIDNTKINFANFQDKNIEDASNELSAYLHKIYLEHSKDWTEQMRNHAERTVTLDCIDRRWTAHIDKMNKLREAIWLRSYAQTDPLQAYANEGFAMFNDMNDSIALDVIKKLYSVQFRANADAVRSSIERAPINKQPEQQQNNNQEAYGDPNIAFNNKTLTNVKPDKEEIDMSNPTAKIN